MSERNTCSCFSAAQAQKLKCPACGGLSAAVPAATARAILKRTVKLPAAGIFSLCVNPACRVYYFAGAKTWTRNDVTVPFDFKSGALPRYACYCNKLTYKQVAEVFGVSGAVKWAEVVKAAKGAVKPRRCAEKNPHGTCCWLNSYDRAIKEAEAAQGRR